MIDGVINIYKERGYTSSDVVAKLRGILRQKKIGHTGTLDPAAEGVLPVCLGKATKLCELLTEKTKEYRCTCRLGVTTDTEDTEGEILSRMPAGCDETQIREAAFSFIGDYQQIPPMYSAIKQNGKRLYMLAREGVTVERPPRAVRIDELEIVRVELSGEEKRFSFRVVCSRGTYIRSLCRDIGEKLGCGAAMEKLERTRSGIFTAEDALRLDEVQKLFGENALNPHILPIEYFYKELGKLTVLPDALKLLDNGNALKTDSFAEKNITGERFRIYDTDDKFRAVYARSADTGLFKPEQMF